MDKKIIEEQIQKEMTKRETMIHKIKTEVRNAKNIRNEEKTEILEYFEKGWYYAASVMIPHAIIIYHLIENRNKNISRKIEYEDKSILDKEIEYFDKLGLKEIENWDNDDFDEMRELLCDSEPKPFSGDIIITDPGYLMKSYDDWHLCNLGDHIDKLGFTNYMVRDTIYGDWSCTTYNSDTKEVIGHFCADAGLVGVFLLNEVLKYNPGFDYHINNKHTTTLIKDFEGTVRFTVTEEFYEYNKNEQCTEYVVRVIGHGKNKVTGEPINFITEQTGL